MSQLDFSGFDTSELQKLLTPKMTKYIPITPTPKQSAFMLMNNTKEILYGGAAGGGKSVGQLASALQFVDIPGYSAILFRRTFADLSLPSALIDLSKQWLMPFVNSGEVRWSEKEKTYKFPSGATLSFGYLENDNDCFRYQGSEFQYIGMDECTHISPANYRYLFSRLRKPKTLNVPLRFRATCNPGGMYSDFYYNRFFVEGEENGRIFISAGLIDNPHLDADEYRQALAELDPVTRAQLEDGNWNVRESGDMFDRHWFPIVPADSLPLNAPCVRFWDLAATDPKKRKKKTRGKDDPDFSVGFKLRSHQGMYIVDDIIRVQKKPNEIENLIRATAEFDGHSCAIEMEKEPGSSGEMVIDHYSRNVLPDFNFKGISSTGSKVERARNASSAAQAGRVLISNQCRNITAFFDELDTFPYGGHDDTIDGFSGAFSHFRKAVTMSAPRTIGKSGGSYWKGLR